MYHGQEEISSSGWGRRRPAGPAAASSQFQTSCHLPTDSQHLAPNLNTQLLFLHAITGCDTTSRPYSMGKVMHGNEQMPSAQGPHQLIHEAKSQPQGCQQAWPGRSRSPVQL